METDRFTGRVLPAVHTLTIPQHSLFIADRNLTSKIDVDIQNSGVSITCEVEAFDLSMLGELMRRAIRIGRASVDLVSFSTGKGLVLVLDQLTLPDGRTGAPTFDFTSAPNFCGAFTLQDIVQVLP